MKAQMHMESRENKITCQTHWNMAKNVVVLESSPSVKVGEMEICRIVEK